MKADLRLRIVTVLAALGLLTLPATASASVCVNGDRLASDPAFAGEYLRSASDFIGTVERVDDQQSPAGTHQVLRVVEPAVGALEGQTLVLARYLTPEGWLMAGDATDDVKVPVGARSFVALSKDEEGHYHFGQCLMLAVATVQRAGAIDSLMSHDGEGR
jgi:hypothetical protein